MGRFIPEANIKQPELMLHYIQYFIWYQMFTGLVQVTGIAIYALLIVPRTELAYAIWIMLIHSTTQYPSMLGVFKNVLGTLQQFNKNIVIDFVQSEFMQRITEIIFVLWGKAYGVAHPEIGMIMGIAIGSVIGLYVDDFIALIFSAKYFQKVMTLYNVTVADCFGHDFDWALAKECLIWGIKSGFPPMLWTIQSYFALLFWLQYVPQYTTFYALFSFAGTFSGLVSWNLNLGGSMAEAFLNGKKNLTRYYLAQSWRYTGLIQFLMISILAMVLIVLEPALLGLGLENYILSVVFIIPRVVRDLQQPYNNISSNMIISAGHVNFLMFTQIMEAGVSLLCWILYIPVLKIPQTFGPSAIIWILPCGELPAIMLKIIVNYIYIEKKILHWQIPVMHTFVIPIISMVVVYLVGRLIIPIIYFPLVGSLGIVPGIVLTVLVGLLTAPFAIYMPLTAFLGGWDDGALEILNRAVKISGWGRVLSFPMAKLLGFFSRISPLHNRFLIPHQDAMQEARELMELRNTKIEQKIQII